MTPHQARRLRLLCLLLFLACGSAPARLRAGAPPQQAQDRAAAAAADQQMRRVERASLEASRSSTVPFSAPQVIRSSGGVLKTMLEVKYADNSIGKDRVHLRSYNGLLLGPTLSLKPGEALTLRLVNNLPAVPVAPGRHDYNVTNLHTHGLQVSPEDNSDNVYLSVRSGAVYDFDIRVPSWHVPGTYWYHAHSHGSVSVQVGSGMAGALIVEGGLDDLDAIRNAKDLPFVFQQCPYDADGRVESPDRIQAWGNLHRPSTINGLVQPVLEMAPGEVQRWRLIHAGIAERLDLTLVDNPDAPDVRVPLYEIATDGIPLGTLRRATEIDLGPGYRSDVLVKAPASGGPFYLVDLRTPVARSLQKGREEPQKVLLRVELKGPARDMPLPDAATLAQVPRPAPLDTTTPVRTRSFDFRGDAPQSAKINGKRFSAGRTDVEVQVGDVEEWCVASGDSGPHPFHMHVNPFYTQLKDPSTNAPYWAWKDTLLVGNGEVVRIKTRFHEGLPGKTVLHCHRLDHEDYGMMQVVRIRDVSPGVVPCPAVAGRRLPAAAPEWQLADALGNQHANSALRSKPHLLFLVKGLGCAHCSQQLRVVAAANEAFAARGFQTVFVTRDSQSDLKAALATVKGPLPFPVLANRSLTVFRALGCVEGEDLEPRHGVFVVDGNGLIQWQYVSEEALLDVKLILEACDRVQRAGGR